MKVEEGMKFKDYAGRLYHIVNVFMDGSDEVVVCRWYSKNKKRWHLTAEYTELFLIAFDYGAKWV